MGFESKEAVWHVILFTPSSSSKNLIKFFGVRAFVFVFV